MGVKDGNGEDEVYINCEGRFPADSEGADHQDIGLKYFPDTQAISRKYFPYYNTPTTTLHLLLSRSPTRQLASCSTLSAKPGTRTCSTTGRTSSGSPSSRSWLSRHGEDKTHHSTVET